jgi:homoserine dehydrogenase
MDGDVIFIDVTAEDKAMIQFHLDIIGKTSNQIVTANKKPAAADMKTFELLTGNPHRYRYNTTVMAGAGAIPYFQEAHGLSEDILSVEGTFSGTLAYVCSELEK